jgi:hypothetical protein
LSQCTQIEAGNTVLEEDDDLEEITRTRFGVGTCSEIAPRFRVKKKNCFGIYILLYFLVNCAQDRDGGGLL